MRRLFYIFAVLAMTFVSCQGTNIQPDGPSDGQVDTLPDGDNTDDDKPDDGQDDEKTWPKEFVILFTNDLHSQIDPVSSSGRGGVLRIKALVDSVRAAEPVVILADAGDFVQGTYYYSILNGIVEAMVLEEVGYDVRTIGNHEFDKKVEGIADMFCWSKVPMVSSNYDFSATVLSEDVHGGYMVEAGGIKVGFVGLGVRLSGLVSPLCCAGVEYEAPVDVAETAAAELRKNGADIVIGLSHLGYSSKSDAPYLDRGFVMNTSSVDMIIGGHTHTYMPVADYVTNLSGRRVPIVQTGSRGYSLGYAKVVIPESGNPSFTYRLIPVDSRLDNRIDPVFASQLSAYSDELASFVEQVIGYSDRVMYTGNPQGLLGNWTTDAMVQMCEDFFGVRPDMAVYNNGGLRAPMPAGNVKVADIYATYPFDNTMTLLHISGSQILGLCDVVASGGYAVGGAVKMTIRDGRTVSVEINGKAVDPSAEYKVVTINYLADDKVQAFNNPISRDDTPDMIRDLFVEYVKKLSEAGKNISAAYDDRIVEL